MNYEDELLQAGIRITAVRLLIWRTLCELHPPHTADGAQRGAAFSLADVQDTLYTIDKSTLFRTLTLFAEQGLLHTIDDGSGMQKYCVCHCHQGEEGCEHEHLNGHVHHRNHVHLSCVKCHKTWCLEDVEVPHVEVPDDFEVTEREYVIKGICKKCRNGWR